MFDIELKHNAPIDELDTTMRIDVRYTVEVTRSDGLPMSKFDCFLIMAEFLQK